MTEVYINIFFPVLDYIVQVDPLQFDMLRNIVLGIRNFSSAFDMNFKWQATHKLRIYFNPVYLFEIFAQCMCVFTSSVTSSRCQIKLSLKVSLPHTNFFGHTASFLSSIVKAPHRMNKTHTIEEVLKGLRT